MRNKPRIRFKGFTEDWEQRKFKDIAFKRGKISEADLPYVEFEDINSGIGTLNKNILQKVGHKKGILFEAGDVLFGKLRPYLQNWLLCQFMGIAVGDFWVFQPQIVSSAFLYYLIQSEAYQSVANISSGTKMPRSSWSLVSETGFSIPKYKEAIMIGEFLTSIDKNITLHQRKLEKLKLAKKALLQKLFPKNGSQFPEIRFKGFTDAWEQRKLLDIAKTFIGLVTTMTENYRDSGTLLIRNSDIKEGQFVFSENPIHLDEEFAKKNKTRRLQIGDVVTVHTGDIGTSAVIEEKEAGAIGFATINTRTDKSILNPYFLATYFNTEKHKCYANSVSTGDGRSNYNIKDFNKLVISVPTLDEQERISVLINDMNTIITLHQCKLDKLQDVKKGLLQKMFV